MRRLPRTARRRESELGIAVRRASASEAVTLWQQLLDGEWVIMKLFDDSSGRRLVFARRAGEVSARAWHSLSPRERSVVAAVAGGRSNREIADTLGISISTVGGYLRSACTKLGGARRLDIVREWGAATDATTLSGRDDSPDAD